MATTDLWVEPGLDPEVWGVVHDQRPTPSQYRNLLQSRLQAMVEELEEELGEEEVEEMFRPLQDLNPLLRDSPPMAIPLMALQLRGPMYPEKVKGMEISQDLPAESLVDLLHQLIEDV